MRTTLELLDRAMQATGTPSRRQMAVKLGMSPTALNNAVLRGTISPIASGQLAELIGENVEHWMAVAVVESEPRSRVTDHLRRVLHTIA